MTSIIENEQVKVETQSTLSSFVGPDTLTPNQSQTCKPRELEDFVRSDQVDFSHRLLQYPSVLGTSEFVPFGPGEVNRFAYQPLELLFSNDLYTTMMSKYFGVSYDSIKVRITVSDPKGISGGVHFGWYPYVDWYDKGWADTFQVQSSKPILTYGMINGPNTHLVSLGASQDVVFSIPWTYKFTCLPTGVVRAMLDHSQQDTRPPYGTPIVWGLAAITDYVTSLTLPAKARVFFEFENLKFYGPAVQVFQAQSGMEVVAIEALAASAVGAAAGVLGELTQSSDPSSSDNRNWRELASSGTFDSPQSVQMAYLGDISSIGAPTVSPIFTSPLDSPTGYTKHSVAEFLSRPQLIEQQFNSDIADGIYLYANPMNPGGSNVASHANQANYLRWFGMLNRWWRGTIHFHVIVLGHPMVEVEFQAFIRPNRGASEGTLNSRFFELPVHTSIFSGTKRIDIPMPFLTVHDHLPLCDKTDTLPETFAASIVNLRLRVVSTMLDIEPTIHALVYMSGGPDFEFEQPRPPGLLMTEFDPVMQGMLAPLRPAQADEKGKGKELDFVAQVFLPFENQKEVFETRACALQTSNILPVIPTIEDYCQIWSRSVPFADYDNDDDEEPTPDATVGLTYATWYPPIDRSEDEDANNSWYFTLDYIAYFGSMFCLWRGCLGIKVIQDVNSQPEYKYITLGDTPSVPHQLVHCPFAYAADNFPADSNPGSGSAVTPTSIQPLLETTLPYRGSNVWSLTYFNGVQRGAMRTWDYLNAEVFHNVSLASDDPVVLQDTLLRKAGNDFALCVETLLPPPTMWIARGYHWS